MKVEQNILEILERSRVDGALLMLPPTQLDRATYSAVNKVIEAAGGRWDRKQRAHVFSGEAIETIEPILLTGEYTLTKQDFGQFDSPTPIVNRVVQLAEIQRGMTVLEPSAGLGNLVAGAEAAGGLVTAFEVDSRRLEACKERCDLGGGIHLRDFLLSAATPIFDRVVMNPPFARQADIRHVLHAAKMLRPGGRLVSVMSASVTFRTDARTEEFRHFLNAHRANHESLPQGAFKESGTMVNSIIVSFDI